MARYSVIYSNIKEDKIVIGDTEYKPVGEDLKIPVKEILSLLSQNIRGGLAIVSTDRGDNGNMRSVFREYK